MGTSSQLSAYERRLWVEVDRILYQNYLSPRTVTDFWAGDRAAIVWHLKQMKERVIRLVVINEYIEVDEELNRAILKRVSPKGARAKRAVLGMLRRLFMKQKVEYLSQLQRVPAEFRKRINALNELRRLNGSQVAFTGETRSILQSGPLALRG